MLHSLTLRVTFLLLVLVLSACGSAKQELPKQPAENTVEATVSEAGSEEPERTAGPAIESAPVLQPEFDSEATKLRGTPIPRHAVRSVAISPDGARLAVGDGDGNVSLVDIPGKQTLWTRKVHDNWSFDLTFTPDGRIVSGGGDNKVVILAAGDGEELQSFSDHADDLHGVSVTPDGKWLISGSDDRQVILRSLETEEVTVLGEHEAQVSSTAVSRSGKLAATSSRDHTVKLWDLSSKALLKTLTGHEADVISVNFSAREEKLVSAGYDNQVIVWNTQEGTEVTRLTGAQDWVFSALFTLTEERVLSGAGDDFVRMYLVSDGSLQAKISLGSDVSDLALSPDGSLLAAGLSAGNVSLLRIGESLEDLGTIFRSPVVVKPSQPGAADPTQK